MFRLYSKGCEYALRGLMHIPWQGPNRASIHEICRQADIPLHFARKMFQRLVQQGLLEAVTGPQGGYRLARPPQRITLLQVIQAIEGEAALDPCVLGFSTCDGRSPCALHDAWVKTKERLLPALQSKTLSDIQKVRHLDRRRRQRKTHA